MKINWNIRFKNKTFLISFCTAIIAFVYQILSMFDVVPRVSENMIMDLVLLVINLLVTLGIVTDPTTEGVSDSERALNYRKLG